MKNTILVLLAVSLLVVSLPSFSVSPSKADLKLIGKSMKQMKALLKEANPTDKVIKVVYFHASDQAPLNGWQERLPRTLADVSDYYKEEFNRFGLESNGLPFEEVKGEISIQRIQGDSVSKQYTIQSGNRIMQEIERKANGMIHFATDHVLVINGLCDKREDSIYYFHSPYGGFGGTKSGICMVADCELLDTRLLKDADQKITFTEKSVNGKNCSVAEFNSWYIGGIAHEMGHIFGLPHDFGGPKEFDKQHLSMMGENGSRHFRDYLWKGEKSASFSTASMLQLMSHPLFTRKTMNYKQNLTYTFKYIDADANDNNLSIRCIYEASETPYGAVALFRPLIQSEYLNQSFSVIPDESGTTTFNLMKQYPGQYVLRILFLFPNSLTREVNRVVKIDQAGSVEFFEPRIRMFQTSFQKMDEQLRQQEKTPDIEAKLEILKGLLNPPTPIDPKTFAEKQLYLSDAKWETAKVGYEQTARNYFTLESEINFFLQLDGKLYSKGLFAHSPSSYVFNLDSQWKSFSATVGLRDNAHIQGSARFTVVGDGQVLYQSAALRVNQKENFRVDLTGIKMLELKTDGTEGHTFNSWAIWVDPLLEK